MVFHLGAVSETTATDGDLTWATNVELPLRLWHWCAAARRAADLCLLGRDLWRRLGGLRGRASEALDRLRPLNLYGWTKHAFDLARRPDAGAPASRGRRNGPG